jgi:hypothetical protein
MTSDTSIKLGKGLSSTAWQLMACKNREFLQISAVSRDSLYVFIETTANIAWSADFCAQIKFSLIAVPINKYWLVTLIQDAVFLYPQRFADGTKRYLLGEKKWFYLDENDPVKEMSCSLTTNRMSSMDMPPFLLIKQLLWSRNKSSFSC